MHKITKVVGREIIDSRGNPTVEVQVETNEYLVTSAAPSGASTGIHEAHELRDGGKRFHGKGVLKSIKAVNGTIAKKLVGMDVEQQRKIDDYLIKIAGVNKRKIGANATTATSLAALRCGSVSNGQDIYERLGGRVLPVPMMNVINGGQHAGNGLAIQEFMIMPLGAKSFREAMLWGSEIYHVLKNRLVSKYGKSAKNVGDEGGFAPNIDNSIEALDALTWSINEAGYKGKVYIAIDSAASSFYHQGYYKIDTRFLTAPELVDYYEMLSARYPIMSIEDPFHEEDYTSFAKLTERIGNHVQIVADDLTVSNLKRLKKAHKMGSLNALLLKVNQVGTISEAFDAIKYCYDNDISVVISHRSGETEDTTIADLAVGLETGQIKTGAPARGERTAKYNQLLRIEEWLGSKAVYPGYKFREFKRNKKLNFL